MRHKLTTLALFFFAYGLAVWGVLAGQLPAIPPGPPDHDRTEACGGGAVSYLHIWDLEGGEQFIVYGQMPSPIEHGPALIRYLVPPGEQSMTPESEVWLTLPGAEPERLTFARSRPATRSHAT